MTNQTDFCPDCGLENGKLCPACAQERIEDQKNFCDCKDIGGCTCELKDVEPLHPICSNIPALKLDGLDKSCEQEREYLRNFLQDLP